MIKIVISIKKAHFLDNKFNFKRTFTIPIRNQKAKLIYKNYSSNLPLFNKQLTKAINGRFSRNSPNTRNVSNSKPPYEGTLKEHGH